MKDAFDFLGDTQIDVEDKPRPPALFVPPEPTGPPEKKEETKGRHTPLQAAAGRNTPLQAAQEVKAAVKEGAKLKPRKKKQGNAFKTLNNVSLVFSLASPASIFVYRSDYLLIQQALYHPHEDQKGVEMRKRIGLARNGPGRFNEVRLSLCRHSRFLNFLLTWDATTQAQQENGGTAPMPGTAFWACMLLTGTDDKKAGSCGGYLLNPPLRLQIPVTATAQVRVAFCACIAVLFRTAY